MWASREKRFCFEPEISARITRIPKVRIYEVGISYYGRTCEKGKRFDGKMVLGLYFAS
jgi:hypothetical protein